MIFVTWSILKVSNLKAEKGKRLSCLIYTLIQGRYPFLFFIFLIMLYKEVTDYVDCKICWLHIIILESKPTSTKIAKFKGRDAISNFKS